jgi:ABC-type phosphate/phosphonate transport system ATPase subunit
VDLALASFPRIVGIRDGRVLFDLAPEKITAELLQALYAGEEAEHEVERFNEILPVSGVCRPLQFRK